MKAYRILVHDTRFKSAQELAAELRNDARAREFASERYGSSDHVRSVEVWSGTIKLCAYGEPPRLAA